MEYKKDNNKNNAYNITNERRAISGVAGGFAMNIELTKKEFRRLLDLVYIGNWVLNSLRDDEEKIDDYEAIERKLFGMCKQCGFDVLVDDSDTGSVPSIRYTTGGIQDAIMFYEDAMFYEVLAEELAKRDMNCEDVNSENFMEYTARINEYIAEFERNGIENLQYGN